MKITEEQQTEDTSRRPPRAKLAPRQRLELMNGLDSERMVGVEGGWDPRSQFPSLEAKREAWEAHKAAIMAVYRGKPYRPAGWWHFEREISRYPRRALQAEVLIAMGEIEAE